MSIEYIRFNITSADSLLVFKEAIKNACKILQKYPDCLGYELMECEEDSSLYIWRINWVSTDAHLNGFRKSELFQVFHEIMSPFIGYIQEMHHYQQIEL